MACAHSVGSVSPRRLRKGGVASLLVIAALSAATSWAGAAMIPLTNPGFETNGSGTIIGTAMGSGIPGWVADATGVTLVGTESVTVAEDPSPAIGYTGGYTGSQVGLFYWSGPSQSVHASGTITATQTITGTPAQPETTYTLQVDIGYRDDGPGGYTDTLPIPETVEIEVLAGGVELASPVRVSPAPAYRNFVTYSVTYTTGATVPSGDLAVEILGTRANTTGSNVPSPPATYNPGNSHLVLGEAFLPFDNVRLDATPLPEPSSLAAVVLGAVLPLTRRRRSA
jgi:hapalindole H/12-epi-hapalindole U/12-epi-fischerindole U synthase